MSAKQTTFLAASERVGEPLWGLPWTDIKKVRGLTTNLLKIFRHKSA